MAFYAGCAAPATLSQEIWNVTRLVCCDCCTVLKKFLPPGFGIRSLGANLFVNQVQCDCFMQDLDGKKKQVRRYLGKNFGYAIERKIGGCLQVILMRT